MVVTKTLGPGALKAKYEVLRFQEIPVNDIEPHPRNPRPKFQLEADDEEVKALADSIKTEGQHNPATVYEISGQAGKYRLVQGERRWRACKLARKEFLRCNVVNTPTSSAEDLEWLGIEESHKQPWQSFFDMKFAYELAQEYGVPTIHPDIATKTGLSRPDLNIADHVFKLEPEIQEMCVKYEQALYEQSLASGSRKRTRLTHQARERVAEFPVQKAALVHEIFEAIRTNFRSAAKDYSDKELQILIANRATTTGATVRDLEQFLSAIRIATYEGSSGFVTELANLLQNPTRTLRDMNKTSGTYISNDMIQFIKKTESLGVTVRKIMNAKKGLGADADVLQKASREALVLLRDVSEFERAIEDRIRKLES